jgi:ribonuclease BN (tRNA processing enzyme)
LRVTVVGCGDAFGAGGRLQTCFHVQVASGPFLLDCGASTLIGLHRLRLDPNEVRAILISHLHGDHYAGLVWWLMHAHYVSGRTAPLVIAGPAGLRERLHQASEVLFPGSSAIEPRYELTYLEYQPRETITVADALVTPFEVNHPSGAMAFALRVESAGRCLSFSGDTEWVDGLVACADAADLFIVDCFGYDQDIGFHMSWKTIASHLPDLRARRLLLTHMGSDMLSRLHEIQDPRILVARDGLVLEVAGSKGELKSAHRLS